jgi:DNA-binding IscR family transcriptional regulator
LLCTRARRCSARRLWKEVNEAIYTVMDRVTLQDLA